MKIHFFIRIGFLFLFCGFCDSQLLVHNHSDDLLSFESRFDSDEADPTPATLISTPNTNTNTNIRKTEPDSHVISLKEELHVIVECRGNDVSSLSIVVCDRSITDCKNKMPCFVNGTMCTTHDEILKGEDCFSGMFSTSMQNTTGQKCLRIFVPWRSRGGMIKCIPALPPTSAIVDHQTNTDRKITIDYFFTGVESEVELLSSLASPFKNLMTLHLSTRSEQMERRDKEDDKKVKRVFYTGEEILIFCTAAVFLFDLTSVRIEVRKENGSVYNIDPALESGSHGLYGGPVWVKVVKRFRVPKDVRSISCAAQRLDNSEIFRRTIEFNVIDPPSPLEAKSADGSNFTVDSKIGCSLNLTPAEIPAIRLKLSNILDFSRPTEYWINSVMQFLRFQEILQGNYSCAKLPSDGATETKAGAGSGISSNSSVVQRFDYYFDPGMKRPMIEKPGESSYVILSGKRHRSLICKYTGNPKPYVIWLYNRKEILYTFPLKTSKGQHDFEESVLHLPLQNSNLDDTNETEHSDSGKNSKSNSATSLYSCVVQNHLGTDRLNFIVENDDFGSSSGSRTESDETDAGLTFGVIFFSLVLFIFVGMLLGFGLIFIRDKYCRRKVIITKGRHNERDADEKFSKSNDESSKNCMENSVAVSENLNPKTNINICPDSECESNEFSQGILNKFQYVEAKYEMLM